MNHGVQNGHSLERTVRSRQETGQLTCVNPEGILRKNTPGKTPFWPRLHLSAQGDGGGKPQNSRCAKRGPQAKQAANPNRWTKAGKISGPNVHLFYRFLIPSAPFRMGVWTNSPQDRKAVTFCVTKLQRSYNPRQKRTDVRNFAQSCYICCNRVTLNVTLRVTSRQRGRPCSGIFDPLHHPKVITADPILARNHDPHSYFGSYMSISQWVYAT